MPYDYIKNDFTGYPFNAVYPPNYDLYDNHGYKNDIEYTFFHLFAVLRYDLQFTYKGITYYFLCEPDYAAQCDETFCNEIQTFHDGNDVLEHFEINGTPLIQMIPLIEDCEAM